MCVWGGGDDGYNSHLSLVVGQEKEVTLVIRQTDVQQAETLNPLLKQSCQERQDKTKWLTAETDRQNETLK